MKSSTEYLWFDTPRRRDLVNVTDRVSEVVRKSGVREGMCLVSAMHITAGIWVNDNEPGLWQDFWEWVERLAPTRPTTSTIARARTTATPTSSAPSSTSRWCCR